MANKTYPLSFLGDKIQTLLNKIENLSKADIELENVDNTSDIDKPISMAVQAELDSKSDKGHTHTASDVEDVFSPTAIKQYLFKDFSDEDILEREGSPIAGQGENGTALLLSGKDSLKISNPIVEQSSDGLSEYTISFKMKTSQAGKGGVWYQGVGIIDGDVGGFHNDFGFAIVDGGYLEYGEGQEGAENETLSVRTKKRVNDGVWHKIVLTRKFNKACMYLDGDLQETIDPFDTSRNVPDKLVVGNLRNPPQNSDCHYVGYIDDIRFYDTEVVPLQSFATVAKTGKYEDLLNWQELQDIKHITCGITEESVAATLDGLIEPGVYRVGTIGSSVDNGGYLNQESEVMYVFVTKYYYESGYNSNMYSYADFCQLKVEASSMQIRQGKGYGYLGTNYLTWYEWQDVTNQTANGGVTTEKLADSAVTEDKLADGAVTEDKLGDDVKDKLNGFATELASKYDYVINSQEDFNNMIASDTWLGATRILFNTDVEVEFGSNDDTITIPQTVNYIDGNSHIMSINAASGVYQPLFKFDTKPTNFSMGHFNIKWYTAGSSSQVLFENLTNIHTCAIYIDGKAFSAFNYCDNLYDVHTTYNGSNWNSYTTTHTYHHCNNLNNCYAYISGFSYSAVYDECTNLIGCEGVSNDSGYDGSQTAGYGTDHTVYNHCQDLVNCKGAVEIYDLSGSGTVYNGCEGLSNCKATTSVNEATDDTNVTLIGFYNCSYATNCRKGSSFTGTLWSGNTNKRDDDSCDFVIEEEG